MPRGTKGRSLYFGQWLCGSVGRAVTSDIRGLRFESSHRQKIIYIEHLFTVNCVLKRRNKEKEAGNGPFFKKKMKFVYNEAEINDLFLRRDSSSAKNLVKAVQL